MQKKLLDLFACPRDTGKLDLIVVDETDGFVKQGFFCCIKCGDVFPVIDKIPRFLLSPDIDRDDLNEWYRFIQTEKIKRSSRKYVGLLKKKLEIAKKIHKKCMWSAEEKSYWEDIYSMKKGDITNYVDGSGRIVGNRRYIREKLIFSNIRSIVKGKILLEVGCGESKNIKQLLDPMMYNYYYVGIDLAMSALRHATKVVNGYFIQANIEYLPFRKNCVDFLLSLGALHHTLSKEQNLINMYRILKPFGFLGYTEVIKCGNLLPQILTSNKMPHHESINEAEAQKIIRKYGTIISYKKEYSPMRSIMVTFFENMMNRNFWITRSIFLIDDIFVNFSQYIELLRPRGVISLTQKQYIDD